jgi:hypothetical protein
MRYAWLGQPGAPFPEVRAFRARAAAVEMLVVIGEQDRTAPSRVAVTLRQTALASACAGAGDESTAA